MPILSTILEAGIVEVRISNPARRNGVCEDRPQRERLRRKDEEEI